MSTTLQTTGKTLRNWLEKNQLSATAFAKLCSSGPHNFHAKRICDAMAGTACSALLRTEIERVTNGEITSDSWSDASPESGPRDSAATELGSTPEEIRASVRRSKALLAKGGLSATQHAQIEGKILSGLGALARLDERAALEDHPSFDAFCDLVHVALERTLQQYGVDPKGARTAFARHLVAAEDEQQRRAA